MFKSSANSATSLTDIQRVVMVCVGRWEVLPRYSCVQENICAGHLAGHQAHHPGQYAPLLHQNYEEAEAQSAQLSLRPQVQLTVKPKLIPETWGSVGVADAACLL